MPKYTENLNLFMYDPSTDGSMPFDVQKALNENFDKIDKKSGSFDLFDTKITDHILEGKNAQGWALQGTYVYAESESERIGYPDFFNRCAEEKEQAIATEITLGTQTITMYCHSNGHQFYDLSNKDVVDAWYETYGIADFYGIDFENKRVFLPRNKNFFQLTDDPSKVNTHIQAGLPNITGRIGKYNTSLIGGVWGAIYTNSSSAGSRYLAHTSDSPSQGEVNFNASLSNPIYGKSNTVQPASSLKLLYYCVGNTNKTTSLVNVTEITSTENDVFPLGYSLYEKESFSSLAWLKSAGQWNPGSTYETFYNTFSNKIGQPFCSGFVKSSTESYTDFDLVINELDTTFRLPLYNGKEDLPGNNRIPLDYTTGGGTYTATHNGQFWAHAYITDTNGGVALQNLNNGLTNRIEVNHTGWNPYVIIEAKKGDVVKAFIEWGNAEFKNVVFFPYIGNGDLYFKVCNAVTDLQIINGNEMAKNVENIQICPHIIESYVNGASGYNVYSNGYCEQWGILDRGDITDNREWTVALLKPYKDTNYNAIAINGGNTIGGGYGWHVAVSNNTKTATSFGGYGWKYEGSNRYINWQTKGYVTLGE